jgi:[citrate (pro-3S)-lyase] ligase
MPGGFDGLGLSFEQVKELVTTPRSHIAENGTKVLDDLTSWGVNIADGHRVVPGSDRGSRTIHMLGDCEMFGTNARDDACIPGWLQRIASERDGWSNIRVTNHGHFVAWNMYNLPRIFNAVDVRPGDIIIANITYGYPKFDQIRLPGLDLSKNLDDRRKYGDIFVDNGHFNEQGYHYFADRIAAWLDAEGVIDVRGAETAGVEHRAKSSAKPLNLRRSTWEYVRDVAGSGVEAASGSIGPDRVNLPDGEQEGLRQYLASLAAIKPAIGAIVMNCNPFTLGHRFLVEESSSKVDKLYIFVVEEDKSFFPFADRLELVKSGTEDLGNVVVVPSGRYIISSLTFDDYFDKGTIQGQAIDPSNDVKIFARYIAPSLGINVRFAGEEPLDAITQQYNDTMARILPQWGIKFDVIARRENDGQVISASRVRSLLEQQNFEAIGQIVPRTTLEYLRARWKK